MNRKIRWQNRIWEVLKRHWLASAILALLTAVMIPVGTSLKNHSDFRIFKDAPFQVLGQTFGYGAILFLLLLICFGCLERMNKRLPVYNRGRMQHFFLHHRFIHWGILFVLIAGVFLFFFPGTVMGDTVAQIREGFGIGATYANMPMQYAYENSRLTAMHPVISTLFIKFCMLVGFHLFGSYNIGLSLVVLFQILLLTYGISRMCYVLAITGVRGGWILGYLIYLFINPMTINYIYLLTKDVIFVGFLLLFFVQMYLLLHVCLLSIQANSAEHGSDSKDPAKISFQKRDFVLLIIAAFGTAAFRGEGLYLILVSLVLSGIYLWIKTRRLRKTASISCLVLAAVLFAAHLLFVQVGYPILQVTPGAKSFQATIPIQQVSRYVLEEKELSEEEQKVIERVLNLEDLPEEFDPTDADPAKKCFDMNASSEDFKAFLQVWGRVLVRDPGLAFTTWLNTKYEYFSLSDGRFGVYRTKTSQNRMAKLNKTVSANGPSLEIHYPARLGGIRNALESIVLHYSEIPILRWLAIPAVYILALLAMLIFFLRNKSPIGVLLMIPLCFVLIITNLLSATNGGYSRYLLPLVLLLPFVMFAGLKKNCNHSANMLK